MRAAIYESFNTPLTIQNVPDPTPPEDGVVIRVEATGLCLSDWHGWMGHDPDITLPHVPGHEMAGVTVEVGEECIPVGGGRAGNAAVCLRLRRLPPVRLRQSPGLRQPVPARLHALGLICRIRRHPPGGYQPGALCPMKSIS